MKKKLMASISETIASITGIKESKPVTTEGKAKNPNVAIKSTIPTVRLYFLVSIN